MTCFKYRWDEDRGDEHADWGGSWWYFEIGPDGYVTRQVEIYDSGVRLQYGPSHIEDEFGGLSCCHEQDIDRSTSQPLTAEEFESVWQSVNTRQ
jgi:hypothetical protein